MLPLLHSTDITVTFGHSGFLPKSKYHKKSDIAYILSQTTLTYKDIFLFNLLRSDTQQFGARLSGLECGRESQNYNGGASGIRASLVKSYKRLITPPPRRARVTDVAAVDRYG